MCEHLEEFSCYSQLNTLYMQRNDEMTWVVIHWPHTSNPHWLKPAEGKTDRNWFKCWPAEGERSKIWCGEKWFTDSWVTGQTGHTRSTEIVTLTARSSEFSGRLFRSNQNDMWQYLAWWCSGSALDMMKSRVCSESCSPTSSVPLSPSCSA